MKYKDYYAILGVKRDAGADDIKTAYRRLARKYHPDVSKEKDAEEKFKEMARSVRDAEGRRRSAPPTTSSAATRPARSSGRRPTGAAHFAQGQGGFDDIDLSDLFAGLAGRQGRGGGGAPRRPADGRQRLRGGRAHLVRAGVPRHRNRPRAVARSNGTPTAACGACRIA